MWFAASVCNGVCVSVCVGCCVFELDVRGGRRDPLPPGARNSG